MYEGLVTGKKRAIDALHHTEEGLPSIVALNAFQNDEDLDGQTHCVLRLYKDISRVNHSCRPNAIVEWDADLGKGTLRALEDIAAGQEISIDYMAKPGQCLRGRNARRADLQRHYKFQCDCHVRRDNNNPASENHKLRVQALKLHRDIESTAMRQTETPEQRRTRKISLIKDYISPLYKLGLKDGKLAWAKLKLSEYHRQGYEFAEAGPNHDHCDRCRDEQSSRWHLDAASEALDDAMRVHMRCCGKKHAVIKDDRKIMDQLTYLASGLPSPVRPASDEED